MKHKLIYYSAYIPLIGILMPILFIDDDSCIDYYDKHYYLSALVQTLSLVSLLIIIHALSHS